MKKLLFTAAIAVLGFTSVNAQEDATTGGFEKGDVYVSGGLGFNSWKQGDAKTNEFTISPSVGYFVSENIAVEALLSFGSGENAIETKTTTLGGSLGATYYFTPASQFSFNVGLAAGYNSQKVEPNVGDESKLNGFAVAVAPGINYFVSDCFALRASIGALSYASAKADFDGAEAANQFGLDLDLSNINFGIAYKF